MSITVLESSPRIGGWIESTTLNNGAIFEHGPRSLRPSGVGKNSLDLVNNLGLSDIVVPVLQSHPGVKNRFIYANGQLHTLPSSLGALFKKQTLFSQRLITSLIKEIFKEKNCKQDESIHSFVSRRFSTEIADYLVDAFCIGIFAADCRNLSVRSCLPLLFDAEQSRGSVVLANLFPSADIDEGIEKCHLIKRAQEEGWSNWTLRGGLQRLPDKMHQTLKNEGVNVTTSTACTSIEFNQTNAGKMVANIRTSSGANIEADHVIGAVSSQALAALLPECHSTFTNVLSSLDAVDVAVVNLEYSGNVLDKQGFGYLIPSNQKCKLLGVVFDSCSFPDNDRQESASTRLTCMMGGSWFQEYFGDPHSVDHDHLLAVAKETIREHLGIVQEPENTAVRVQHKCITSYRPGHFKTLENLESYIEERNLPLSLVGSSYYGVSVNDCIYNARKTAERIINSI
ncbi:protoporphyrinogen oxidase-like isoform X2 [Anneissia japonica]|uniref:protoporphyrinogen oxidase-like isoform X2 n=1 Tax=Anneissia japonica TaxID=1529436 RepID=UPI001425791F|nr:protoporphyrinogen oxidase-like isoform X2 [Anneissia japonica]